MTTKFTNPPWRRIKLKVKQLNFLLILFLATVTFSFAQPLPVLEWQKTYGGNDSEIITSWAESTDGYLIGGVSYSPISGEKTENSRGGRDFWIIKIDKSGNKVWDKTFGGTEADDLSKIVKSSDGFYLCGTSISPVGGDKSEPSRGRSDFWIIKIDENGQKIWDKTFGGSLEDGLVSAICLGDNSLILAGTSRSGISGDKTSPSKSEADYWVLKISQSGTKVWDKTFGGSSSAEGPGEDNLSTIISTADGGFVLGGKSYSINGNDKTSGLNADAPVKYPQYWIVKINDQGNKVWDKSYGSKIDYTSVAMDEILEIVNTPDNGFIIGGEVRIHTPGSDYYEYYDYHEFIRMRKLDSEGNLVWEKDHDPNAHALYMYLHAMAVTPQGVSFVNATSDYDASGPIYIALYNFEGLLQYNVQTTLDPIEELRFIKYDSIGNAFVSVLSNDYKISKFKSSGSNPTPYLGINIKQSSIDLLNVTASPQFFTSEILKVELFIGGEKVRELTQYPYYFLEENNHQGILPVQLKAYTKSGQVYSSEAVNFNFFSYWGTQAELDFYPVSDVGGYPIQKEKSNTLNSGSSVRLWDIGDKAKWYFWYIENGRKYKIKVHLRSGIYTLDSSNSNPSEFWPDGYTFSINGSQVKFIGDPASVSEKNPAYDGSYWGTMISPELTLNRNDILEIQANKQWLGVDYIEVVPTPVQFPQGIDLGAKNTFTSMNAGGVSYVPYERSQNFTFTGKLYENQSLPVNPQADANTSKLLRSVVYGTSSSPATFNFTNLQTGPYNFYVYVWEDNVASTFSLKAEGKTVLTNYNTGGQGKWAKLGPFRSYVTDGALNIATSGGDANISGIELWKLPSEDFKVAYNFNGPATTIDNLNYQSSIGALNVQLIRGRLYANQTIALNPSTDSNRAAMIRSSYYSSASQPLELRIKGLENVAYNAYIYVWEDNSTSTYTLKLSSGTEVNQNSINSGTKGQWKKLGPYRITITGGVLDINVFNGDGNISGIELWKINDGSSPSSARLADLSFEEDKATKAYPNPIQSELTIDLPSTVKGKVNITLSDAYGKQYYSEKKNVGEEGQVLLTLPSNKLKPGIYFLKIQSNTQEEVIRLTKE